METHSRDICWPALTNVPTPLRARRDNAFVVPAAKGIIPCAPLCTSCGLHPISSRKAVARRALCCNRCPDHGTWCTSHMAKGSAASNSLALKPDKRVGSLTTKPQSRPQCGKTKCTLIEASTHPSTPQAECAMPEEAVEKGTLIEGSAAAIAQRRKSLRLPLLESLKLQAMENPEEKPVLRKASESEIFNWAESAQSIGPAQSYKSPLQHEAPSAEAVLPSSPPAQVSMIAMGETESRDSAEQDKGYQHKAKSASPIMPRKAPERRQHKRALSEAPLELMLPRLKRRRDVKTVSAELRAEAAQQSIH